MTTSTTTRIPLRRVIFTRGFLVGLLVALLGAGTCTALGIWQWGRFEQKRVIAATIETNYSAAPLPFAQARPHPAERLASSADWTPVTMTGHYCSAPDCVLYVRNRTYGGEVGFWQLVPFTDSASGRSILVVRGWVEMDERESVPAHPAAVPTGEVTVTAHLRPAEAVLAERRNLPGQVQSVAPAQVAQQLSGAVHDLDSGAYADLTSESSRSARPQPLPAPAKDLGPHLSYAFQWWIFACFFPLGLILWTRATWRDQSADTAPTPKQRRRIGIDEEEEDALIDDHRI